MGKGPAMIQATVGKVYQTGSAPHRRAVCLLKQPRNHRPVSVPIPDKVAEGDRIMVRRDQGDSYRFIRAL